MSVTRQPIVPKTFVELHGERPAVVITYHDGERHRVWRCYFDDAEELAVDLQLATKHNGDGPLLPQCAADAALACVRETIGSYDELFADTEPSCPATDAQRARMPPAAFQCWQSRTSRLVELFAESVWVLAAVGVAVLVLGAWL